MRKRTGAALCAVALALLLPLLPTGAARAAYPNRTITLVVPFDPGGPTDIIARVLAKSLSQSLNQSVIVENKPGAAGNLGMGLVARATPDGYTLLLTSTAIAVNPAIYKKLPYDPFKDFAPISELVDSPNVLVVKPSSGINTVPELVERAKAKPGTLNYSSPGIGTKSNLTGEELKQRTGIQMTHIAYRGAGPAALAVVDGTVQVGSVALPAAESMIKSGQLKALAVTGPERWYDLPDVPTMIEAGYPNFISVTFNALFAPAGTPQEIIDLLAAKSREALSTKEAQALARNIGFTVVAGTPAQLAERVKTEVPAVKALLTRAGLTFEQR
jgi:tripartite-type tricarboxylate transporter receptor subunit TctC